MESGVQLENQTLYLITHAIHKVSDSELLVSFVNFDTVESQKHYCMTFSEYSQANWDIFLMNITPTTTNEGDLWEKNLNTTIKYKHFINDVKSTSKNIEVKKYTVFTWMLYFLA